MEGFETSTLLLNGTSAAYREYTSAAIGPDLAEMSAVTEVMLGKENTTNFCDNLTDIRENVECYDKYLSDYLGPRSLPSETLIPVTIIYILIFVTGVFGNVTTCIVILTNQYMRTATNYYLFNLALSDMTTLVVGMFKPIFTDFPRFGCSRQETRKLFNPLMSTMLCNMLYLH